MPMKSFKNGTSRLGYLSEWLNPAIFGKNYNKYLYYAKDFELF